MDLLLWRHAEAEDGANDLQRPLTARGENQARHMAHWIRDHRPKNLRILVSPAARCQQTAAALGLPFETTRTLGPDAYVPDLISVSGWPNASGSALLVGHQPAFGRLASMLLSGQEADWPIKKGALWWITLRVRAGQMQTVLRGIIASDFLP